VQKLWFWDVSVSFEEAGNFIRFLHAGVRLFELALVLPPAFFLNPRINCSHGGSKQRKQFHGSAPTAGLRSTTLGCLGSSCGADSLPSTIAVRVIISEAKMLSWIWFLGFAVWGGPATGCSLPSDHCLLDIIRHVPSLLGALRRSFPAARSLILSPFSCAYAQAILRMRKRFPFFALCRVGVWAETFCCAGLGIPMPWSPVPSALGMLRLPMNAFFPGRQRR